MEFYYARTSCSQAAHIMLREIGEAFVAHAVDLETGRLSDGRAYAEVHPNGYVPALVLADGRLLTESVAVLDWLTQRAGRLAAESPDRTRHLQLLAFLSSELHKPFVAWFTDDDADRRAAISTLLSQRLDWIAGQLSDGWLLGDIFVGADAFLYVIWRWSMMIGLDTPSGLVRHAQAVEMRPSVLNVLATERLEVLSPASRAA